MSSTSLLLLTALLVLVAADPLRWDKLDVTGSKPDGRRDACAAFHANKQTMIVFGGRSKTTGAFGDLHMLNLKTKKWSKLPSAGGPAPRFRFVCGVDQDNDVFYVPIGEGPDSTFYNDVWAYDLSKLSWKRIDDPDDGSAPTPRYGSAGDLSKDGKLIVAQGFAHRRFAEVFEFDINARKWSEATPRWPQLSAPIRRCLHSGVWLDDKFVMFGGCSSGYGPCPLGDGWMLEDEKWTRLSGGPVARAYTALAPWTHDQKSSDDAPYRAIAFGGKGASKVLDDLLIVDVTSTLSWREIRGVETSKGGSPGARYGHTLTAVQVDGEKMFVVFGGVGDDGAHHNDVWLLRGDSIKSSVQLISIYEILTIVAVLFGLLSVGLSALLYLSCGRHRRFVQQLLYRRIGAPPSGKWKAYFLSHLYDMTYGEALLVAAYFAVSILLLIANLEDLGFYRAVTRPLMFSFLLLLFPCSRHSPLRMLIGIPFDRAIKYHRRLGECIVVMMIVHFAGIASQFKTSTLLDTDPPVNYAHQPAYSIPAAIIVLLMFVTAAESIRRKKFEVFYYIHQLAVVALVLIFLHAAVFGLWLLPGALLHLVDRLMRLREGWRAVEVVSATALPGVTRLELRKPGLKYTEGQFVFINVKQVSKLQWHPFSISSGTRDDHFTLHIKDMGEGTWTHVLHELAQSLQPLSVYVEGPYGRVSVDVTRCSTVALVAGGIGITPIASILEGIIASRKASKTASTPRQRVLLVWTVRGEQEMNPFEPLMAQALDAGVDVHVHLTKSSAASASWQHTGRPNFKQYLEGLAASSVGPKNERELEDVSREGAQPATGSETTSASTHVLSKSTSMIAAMGVCCCGPEAMVQDVQREAHRIHSSKQAVVLFHKETFLL